jgi:hypothetical protein
LVKKKDKRITRLIQVHPWQLLSVPRFLTSLFLSLGIPETSGRSEGSDE